MSKAAAKTKPVKAVRLGDLVDSLFDIREAKGALQAQMRTLEIEETQLETQVLEQFEAHGLDQLRGERALVSVSKSVVPQVKDWDAINQYILRFKKLELFQRRLSVTAYREAVALNKGKALPGVEEFEKITINVRKA